MQSSSLNRENFKKGPVCKGRSQSLIYGWAMDAPSLVLPKDVAFKVGGETVYSHIVMEIHYGNVNYFKGMTIEYILALLIHFLVYIYSS